MEQKAYKKYLDKVIEIKIRIDRGNGLLYWARNVVIMTAGIKYILNLNVGESIFLGLFGVAFLYFLGWLDINKINFMQRENELTTEKYNNYFKKLKNSVNRTSRKV